MKEMMIQNLRKMAVDREACKRIVDQPKTRKQLKRQEKK
jgi:hypothetical protein